jgi:hypothetical protein
MPAGVIGGHDVVHVVKDDGMGCPDIHAGVDDRRAARTCFVGHDLATKFAPQPASDLARLQAEGSIVVPHRRDAAPM